MQCNVQYGSIALVWMNYGANTYILHVSFYIMHFAMDLVVEMLFNVGEWFDGLRFTVVAYV